MDALKLISESSMKKENVPAFNIGDTVNINTIIRPIFNFKASK